MSLRTTEKQSLINPILFMTDTNDSKIRTLSLGSLSVSSTHTFSFRVHNNIDNLKGIPKAEGVELILQIDPKRVNRLAELTIQGKCTHSDKQSGDPNDSFSDFPLVDSAYDTISSGGYNEYECQLDFGKLNDNQQDFIKDSNPKLNITVRFD